MRDRIPSYNREPVYWSDDKLDLKTIGAIQRELDRIKDQRKKRGSSVGETEKGPVRANMELIRDALQAETGLEGLKAIDDSIRRVATFDETNGGISGINPEILEKLQITGFKKLEK